MAVNDIRMLKLIGVVGLSAICFFGYFVPDYKRPVIVQLGPKLGSLVESRNHHPALLYTHEMLETGETLRYEGTIYRITERGKDCEWGNMYTLEMVADEQ